MPSFITFIYVLDVVFVGFNNVYQNIHNVLVRIGPLYSETNRTLLINCHFDAAIGVDGASDDLSQCVVMLEALTVLAQRTPLACHVLFLFNGAEESILQVCPCSVSIPLKICVVIDPNGKKLLFLVEYAEQ